MSRQPIFEVVLQPSGHRMQVYADGEIEGFPRDAVIVNRIPDFLQEAAVDALSRRADKDATYVEADSERAQ